MLALVASAPARADDEVIARAHYSTGLASYDARSYELAVQEFARALKLAARPPLLFNIARAYEKLGDAGRAVLFYERYLELAPADSTERPQIQKDVQRLRSRVATLKLESTHPISEVLLEDRALEIIPTGAFPVTAGRRRITVRSGGMLDHTQAVDLRAGEERSLRVELISLEQLSIDTRRARRARWMWPVVGVSVAVTAGIALTLGLTSDGQATPTRHAPAASPAAARSSTLRTCCDEALGRPARLPRRMPRRLRDQPLTGRAVSLGDHDLDRGHGEPERAGVQRLRC